jgi:hypothetical protein
MEQVCIYRVSNFVWGCGKHLPGAAIPFHELREVKVVNKAMDEPRKLRKVRQRFKEQDKQRETGGHQFQESDGQ